MFFVSPKNTTRDQKQNAGHNLTPKTQHQNLKKYHQNTKKWCQICVTKNQKQEPPKNKTSFSGPSID